MSTGEEKTDSAAEQAKKLGNEHFAAKEYEEAIKHYSEAIKLDSNNPVYYSNRSACYFAQKNWEAAAADANSCIEKDPKFVKGFYRLALALTEQGSYDDASSALLTASKIEPDNAQLLKQLRIVRAKKAALAKKQSSGKDRKELDEQQRKELQSLNEEMQKHGRDLRSVQNSIAVCQRELRSNEVTSKQIRELDESTALYRACGKAFYMASHEEIKSSLEKEAEVLNKNAKDLSSREEYLERRIASNRSNMIDIAS